MARRCIALCLTALCVGDCAAAQEEMPGAVKTEYLAKVDSSTGRDARATALDNSDVTYADGVFQFARSGVHAVLGVTGDVSADSGSKGTQPAPTNYLPTGVARSSGAGAADVCGISPWASASEHSKAHWEFTSRASAMYCHTPTDGFSQSCASIPTFLADTRAAEGRPNRSEMFVHVEANGQINFLKRFDLPPPVISKLLYFLIPSLLLPGIAATLRRFHSLLDSYATTEIIQTPGEQICGPAKLRRIGRIDNMLVCDETDGLMPLQI